MKRPCEALDEHATRANLRSINTRNRILLQSSILFANRGFHGTHIRDICKLAKANLGMVCYHFRGKRGLYEAVQNRALERLFAHSKPDSEVPPDASPETRLRAVIQSLFEQLSGESQWIAQLMARELIDDIKDIRTTIARGFNKDLQRIELSIQATANREITPEIIHLTTLNVLMQTIFYCASRKAVIRHSNELKDCALKTEEMISYITLSTLGAWSEVLSLRQRSTTANSSNPTKHREPRQTQRMMTNQPDDVL